jgi:hypothetical protein
LFFQLFAVVVLTFPNIASSGNVYGPRGLPVTWSHQQAKPQSHYSQQMLGQSWQTSSGSSSGVLLGPLRPPPPPPPPLFTGGTVSYAELVAATRGFSDANLLGQGGFGHVYRGTLERGGGGGEVAIKRLRPGSGQGDREFRAEVEIISRVHHRHLVSLVGYCIHGDQRLLVYEYVPNKTLELHLHGTYVRDSVLFTCWCPSMLVAWVCIACTGTARLRWVLHCLQGVVARCWIGSRGGGSHLGPPRDWHTCTRTVSSSSTVLACFLFSFFFISFLFVFCVKLLCVCWFQVILRLSTVTSRRQTYFWITISSPRQVISAQGV